MGVKGLYSYLCNEENVLQDLKLRNTNIIIDLGNFETTIDNNSGKSQFSGEYADLVSELAVMLLNFKKCSVRPVFVYDGTREPNHKKFDEIVRRRLDVMKFLYEYDRDVQDIESPHETMRILPSMAHRVVIDLLTSFGAPIIVCDYEGDADLASLAAYTGSAVLSGDTDFVIFNHSTQLPKEYVFVSLLHLVNELRTDDAEGPYMPAKTFNLANSILSTVPRSFLPIAGAMVGNDTISYMRLPHELMQRVQNDSSISHLSKRHRRIRVTFEWLSANKTDTRHIVESLLRAQGTHRIDEFLALLHYNCLQYYLPTHVLGKRMAERLNFDSLHAPALRPQVKLFQPGTDLLQDIVDFMADAYPDSYEQPNLTANWPPEFARLFYAAKIDVNKLDAVYTKGGIVHRPLMEDMRSSATIYMAGLGLRRIHYGLILAFEEGGERALGLSDGRLTEYFCEQQSIYRGELAVQPVVLRRGETVFNRFLYEETGFACPQAGDGFPAQLAGLCCLLAYHQLATSYRPYPQLHRAVLLLSVAGMAVVSDASARSLVQSVSTLAANCALYADELRGRLKRPPRLAMRLNSCLNELQSIARLLIELKRVVDALGVADPLVEFASPVALFPSCRLLHYLLMEDALCARTDADHLRRFLGEAAQPELVKRCLEQVEAAEQCMAACIRASSLKPCVYQSVSLYKS